MELGVFNTEKIIDKEAFIVYCNAKNELNKYHLVNVSTSEGHFQGVSLPERRFKTFKKDRVMGFYTGISALEDADLLSFRIENLASTAASNSRQYTNGNVDICFTGFSKLDRGRLETIAMNHGMSVKKDVSKKLNFLCCGYNAGPSKKSAALENGTLALTENQFLTLVDTGEIPDQGEYDLLLLDEEAKEKKAQDILDTFSTLRTLPRRQTLLANFINDYAVGWRFKVHSCHKPSLDIRLTDITYNNKSLQVWTQGHAFNFIGGELIESWPVENELNVALQIKFTSPAGFDTVDTIEGEFTGVFRKNNASSEKGEFGVEQLPVKFNSQSYDEGSLTVDVYIVNANQFTLKERVTLTQVEFVTLLQFGRVIMVVDTEKGKRLDVYDPFAPLKS
jgi:hypothetical protein